MQKNEKNDVLSEKFHNVLSISKHQLNQIGLFLNIPPEHSLGNRKKTIRFCSDKTNAEVLWPPRPDARPKRLEKTAE